VYPLGQRKLFHAGGVRRLVPAASRPAAAGARSGRARVPCHAVRQAAPAGPPVKAVCLVQPPRGLGQRRLGGNGLASITESVGV
jgi:hypothetical protein